MQAQKLAHFAPWRSILCALSLSCCLTSSALAGMYSYPDAAGSTVVFTNISETPNLVSVGNGPGDQQAHFNAIDPLAGPFGQPAVTGNSLSFNPSSFAVSIVGPGTDTLDSQLNVTITAKAGYGIDAFSVQEAGDVFFGFGATNASWAAVAAAINVSITQIDGKAVTPIWVPASNAIFIPTGTFDGATNPLLSTWTGSGYIDIGGYLASQNIMGTATSIDVALDNTLYVGSSENKLVKIQKKLFDGTSFTVETTPGNPIPEPSSMVLAAIGIVGIGWYGRRNLRRS